MTHGPLLQLYLLHCFEEDKPFPEPDKEFVKEVFEGVFEEVLKEVFEEVLKEVFEEVLKEVFEEVLKEVFEEVLKVPCKDAESGIPAGDKAAATKRYYAISTIDTTSLTSARRRPTRT
jgi:hypothetical protein